MVKQIFLLLIMATIYASAGLQYLTETTVAESSFENPIANTWAATDDDSIEVNIGFDFPFNGATYSSVWINSNGMISFNSRNTAYTNATLPYTNAAQSIYPYWDDLNPANGGAIKYGTIGTGDEQHFVVSWESVPHYPSDGAYSFQVVLYKNGDIRFRYDSTSSIDGSSATVGVQESIDYYEQHSYNSAGSFDATKDILYQLPASIISVTSITPNCTTPIAQLEMSTYDTTGYNDYPDNSSEYETLIQNYATDNKWFGSGYQNNIDGSGNPYGYDEDYLTQFEGYIYLPTTGIYKFGLDGDDAIELYLDDTWITGWYGGHAKAGEARYIVNVYAQSGWHKLDYHHQERGGGDNYYLYWEKPNGSMEKVPASQFFHCRAKVTKTSVVTSDPTNGTDNPKRIPGANIEYKIRAINLGNIRISNAILADTLESDFDWVTDSIEVTSPSINGGVVNALTDANDGDNGTFDGTKVEVNCQTLKKDEECLVTFDVTIK